MNKQCSECKEIKLIDLFYKKPRIKEYAGLAGYSHKCRECTKIERKIYVKANKDKCAAGDRDYKLRVEYGINLNDYNKLFDEQQGKCLGCNRHQSEVNRPLCVDHDHLTGLIRGLLCVACNLMLGYAKDDVSILQNLINYLNNSRK